MGFREYLPFQQAPSPPKLAQIVKPDTQKKLSKLMKATTLALGISPTFMVRSNFEPAPYNFNKIIQAIDTDSYVKQAFNKYKELMWKSGWDFVSEESDAVEYLYRRIDFMEIAMKQPFQQFLETALDQLVKFSNCFIVKCRGDLDPYFPDPLKAVGKNDQVVIGYELVPCETMWIERDAHNRPLKYRQNIAGFGGFGQPKAPEWDPSEVIHLHVDKKPGYMFGTPFVTAVIDDVLSLRQLEEDIQNLVHQELFPFYSVKVGTPDEPAEDEEIIQAAEEIAAMRAEGAMVHSERREISVIGADGHALQAEPYMNHFKERVCVGLGLAPIHLGMAMGSTNRSASDRLDIALYDKVKVYQRYGAAAFRIFILNELLLEGGFNPYMNQEHTTMFRFREIDVDTMIKLENHLANLYTGNVIEIGEARMGILRKPEIDESKTFAALAARMTPDTIIPGEKTPTGGTKPPTQIDTTPQPARPNTALPSSGGKPNPVNGRRGTGNLSQPANQHGRRLSPNIRHDDDFLDSIVEMFKDEEEF